DPSSALWSRNAHACAGMRRDGAPRVFYISPFSAISCAAHNRPCQRISRTSPRHALELGFDLADLDAHDLVSLDRPRGHALGRLMHPFREKLRLTCHESFRGIVTHKVDIGHHMSDEARHVPLLRFLGSVTIQCAITRAT